MPRSKNHIASPALAGLKVATGLLGVVLAASGCTGGESAPVNPRNTTPGTTQPSTPRPENQGNKPDPNVAKSHFDEVNRQVGRTVTCMLMSPNSEAAPTISHYYGNVAALPGPDHLHGTEDDSQQQVEMHVQTDPEAGSLYFWAAADGEGGDIVYTNNSVLVPKDESVFAKDTINLDHVLTALNDPTLSGESARETADRDDPMHLVQPRPEYVLRYEDGVRPAHLATVEDLNRWTQETYTLLDYFAEASGNPGCAPQEPMPVIPLPIGGGDLPPELRV